MKHLGRLGSIAFSTITISLVFHLIGMSFNNWIENNCINCSLTNPLATWRTSVRSRCYLISMGALFISPNSSIYNLYSRSFIADVCVPNQILMAKDPVNAYDCLLYTINNSHTICSIPYYDHSICKCDYTSRTKAVLAMTILTALSLGIMVFISHTISYIKFDYILKWLFPISFGLLSFSILCIIITLAVFSGTRYQDINELIYSSSLVSASLKNQTLVEYWKQYIASIRTDRYQVKIGWSFGMEILSLQFLIVTLVLFILMFMAKNRPEPENS